MCSAGINSIYAVDRKNLELTRYQLLFAIDIIIEWAPPWGTRWNLHPSGVGHIQEKICILKRHHATQPCGLTKLAYHFTNFIDYLYNNRTTDRGEFLKDFYLVFTSLAMEYSSELRPKAIEVYRALKAKSTDAEVVSQGYTIHQHKPTEVEYLLEKLKSLIEKHKESMRIPSNDATKVIDTLIPKARKRAKEYHQIYKNTPTSGGHMV